MLHEINSTVTKNMFSPSLAAALLLKLTILQPAYSMAFATQKKPILALGETKVCIPATAIQKTD